MCKWQREPSGLLPGAPCWQPLRDSRRRDIMTGDLRCHSGRWVEGWKVEGEGGGETVCVCGGGSPPLPKPFHIHHPRPWQDRLTASDTKTKRRRSFVSVSLQRRLALHPHPLFLPPSSWACLPRQALPPPPHTCRHALDSSPPRLRLIFTPFPPSVSCKTSHPSHVWKPELAGKRQHKCAQDVIKVKLRSRVEHGKDVQAIRAAGSSESQGERRDETRRRREGKSTEVMSQGREDH